MKFWDSSAIVPLILKERSSNRLQHILKDDPVMVVWAFTQTEIYSAITRRLVAVKAPKQILTASETRLNELYQSWSAITDYELVLKRARRVISVHGLRSADALQLAAALVFFEEQPENTEFVCLDEELALAASKEGFKVLGIDSVDIP